MAELITMATPAPPAEPEPKLIVDMNVVEYFYAATFEDIINDDALVKLIITNPFYQQALCEAFQMVTVTIQQDGKEYIFKDGTPTNVSSTLEMLQGKTKIHFPDTEIINLQ